MMQYRILDVYVYVQCMYSVCVSLKKFTFDCSKTINIDNWKTMLSIY